MSRTSNTALAWLLAASPIAVTGAQEDSCLPVKLLDVTATSGVAFQHVSGAAGDKHLPETMGGGIAWLDYDGDGWQDLYLVQSGAFPPDGGPQASNQLFAIWVEEDSRR